MKILLTSTSFKDTPGTHQEKLYNAELEIDTLRGPVKEDVLLPIIANYDGIICGDDEITRNVIKTGLEGNLKVISKYGVGLDKIDLKAAKELGIPVTNCPGVNHITVAEHVIALLLTYYKNIHLEYNITKQGGWKRLVGHEVYEKRIGIVGMGKIGKEVAIRAQALGLEVFAYDPDIDLDFVESSKINAVDSIEELIADIDILSLNLPLTEQTKGMINNELLSKAKRELVIVNTSRALIVDQDSLLNSLNTNKIKAYLTDVMEEEPMIENHPLLQYENVIITGGDIVSEFAVSGFQSLKAISTEPCKPFDKDRNGLTLGDGCGTIILTSNAELTTGKTPITVLNGSTTNDANHISGPSRTGEGLYLAIKNTVNSVKNIDYISAHGTATIYNDEMEAKAICLAGLEKVPVNSFKGFWGHTQGAAGIIESIAAIHSLKENILFNTIGFNKLGVSKNINVINHWNAKKKIEINNCLKLASGFGGSNAAVLFSKKSGN